MHHENEDADSFYEEVESPMNNGTAQFRLVKEGFKARAGANT